MTGVQAIFGGIVAIAVFAVIAVIGVSGLLLGALLWRRQRKTMAGISATVSVAMLIFACSLLIQTQRKSLATLHLDLRNASTAQFQRTPFECNGNLVPNEVWCFVENDVEELHVVLPDGSDRRMSARSLYVVLRDGALRKLSFMPGPLSTAAIQRMVSVEEAASPATPHSSEAQQKVSEALSLSTESSADQYLHFAQERFVVRLWVLPRHRVDDPYDLWYEVLLP